MNSADPKFSLATIVLNYRTPQMTIECLETAIPEHEAIGGSHIIVVDNCSGDDSVERIETAVRDRHWGHLVRVIASPVNGGFAAGNNVALEAVQADYYLLLNSDTLVRPGAIVELLRVLKEREDIGLIGPRIEWPDGKPQNTCYRFRTPITEFLAAAKTGPLSSLFASHVGTMPTIDEPCEPQWTSFACCLIRREVFDQIGLLDPGYFMYFDDIDFCHRAYDAGWKVLNWPSAHVVHLRGQSGPVKKLAAERKRRPAYFYHSRNRYHAKFRGRIGLWFTNILWTLGRGIALVRELCRNKEPHTCEHEARDVWLNGWTPMDAPHLSKESKS